MQQCTQLTVTNSPFGLTIKFYCEYRVVALSASLMNRLTAVQEWPVNIRNPLGDHSERVPPVPIPNTVVKLLSPDGTARATVWESRKSPGSFIKKPNAPGFIPGGVCVR